MPRKNIEERKVYLKAYYAENRDKLKATSKAYHAAHREKLRANNDEFLESNPAGVKA